MCRERRMSPLSHRERFVYDMVRLFMDRCFSGRSASPSSAAVVVDVQSVDSTDGVDADVNGRLVVGDDASVDTDMVDVWLVVDDELLNAADARASWRPITNFSRDECLGTFSMLYGKF